MSHSVYRVGCVRSEWGYLVVGTEVSSQEKHRGRVGVWSGFRMGRGGDWQIPWRFSLPHSVRILLESILFLISFWTSDVIDVPKVTRIISLPNRYFRFSIFFLDQAVETRLVLLSVPRIESRPVPKAHHTMEAR